MPRLYPISRRLVPALFALLLCSIPTIAAEPTPWLEIHSTHFTVVTDAGDKKGREVALRFEQMRSVFASLLGKDRLNQPVPLTILALKNDKSYYQVAPLHGGQPIDVPGFFLSGEDQDFIVLNLLEDESWRSVAHDFAATLLSFNYPPAQGWFDDGVTEYFSSIGVDDKQVQIGGDPDTHPPTFTELLSAQDWLPLTDLFSVKPDPSNHGPHRTLYEAESWMVMHYLLHEQKLPETGSYFGLVLNQHIPVEDAIQKAYGMTSAQLEQAVKDYFHSQTAALAAHSNSPAPDHPSAAAGPEQPVHFPSPVGPEDSAILANAFPESDARALYAEIAIRVPERREFGLKELHALATAPTVADKKAEAKVEEKKREQKNADDNPGQLPSNAIGSALAHRILASDHIQRGEFDDALSELGDAAALNRSDMWIRYYLSLLKYRVAQARHTDIQGLPNMMIDLRAVLDWYPEFAAAYDLLALARNEGGTSVAAMQAERAAMTLSPRNERYIYHLAQIYIASKKFEAASALLERLKTSGSPELATLASDQLAQAGAERRYGIPLNSAVTAQPKLSPQKTPFDVLDEDAAKRSAEEKAAQSGGPSDMRPTKFLKGRLLTVDCSQTPAAILTVSTGASVMKLRAVDYKSLLLIGADDFSCTWTDRQVSVNYKPGGVTDGDLVSLEMR